MKRVIFKGATSGVLNTETTQGVELESARIQQ
jgi:hypothetical protein